MDLNKHIYMLIGIWHVCEVLMRFSRCHRILVKNNFSFSFAISWATPAAYGGSQARGQIEAVATGLCQSHSNAGSEPHLQPTPQLTQRRIVNPLSKGRDRTRNLMVPGRIR